MLCPFARKPSHSAALLLSLSGTAADIGGRPSACRISRVAQSLIHSLSVPQAREKMGREAKEDVEMEDDHDDVDLGVDEESSVCLSVGFGA